MEIYSREMPPVGRILRNVDRDYQKSIKEVNGASSFNLWQDLDHFNRNRKHNQLSTIGVYERQPWRKFYHTLPPDLREDFNSKITNVKSDFVKRFEDEYITAIQECEYYNHKKFKNNEETVIGDVVVVKEDNLPRMSWRKGQIINVIRGIDKLIKISSTFKISSTIWNYGCW